MSTHDDMNAAVVLPLFHKNLCKHVDAATRAFICNDVRHILSTTASTKMIESLKRQFLHFIESWELDGSSIQRVAASPMLADGVAEVAPPAAAKATV